jgi:hypothetical protein
MLVCLIYMGILWLEVGTGEWKVFVKFKIFFLIFIMTWVYLVTSGHFCVSTEWAMIFRRHSVVTNGSVLSCWTILILIFSDCFLAYVLILFIITVMMLVCCALYWFSCWGVICCFSCYEVVFCFVVANDYLFTIWFNFRPLSDETRSLLLLMASKILCLKGTDEYCLSRSRNPKAVFWPRSFSTPTLVSFKMKQGCPSEHSFAPFPSVTFTEIWALHCLPLACGRCSVWLSARALTILMSIWAVFFFLSGLVSG